MENDKEIKSRVVETYAEDMAKVIEGDNTGLIKKIIHGEEEHEKEKKELSPESTKNKIFIILGVFFLLLGVATLVYFWGKREVPIIPVEKQFSPLIFHDKSTFIEVKDFHKDEITGSFLSEVDQTDLKTGGVEGIYLTENKVPIGLRKFSEIIGADFVPASTNFVSDNFLMGVVNTQTKDPFILIKMRSMPDIFDSLRAWEGKMYFDLRGFFSASPVSTEAKYLLTKNFEDGIIENKNARILYDNSGHIILMYVFADDNSIIITDSINAVHEVISRLASSKVKK